jgi:hypothetical protein
MQMATTSHERVQKRLNIRREVLRIRDDPLANFLNAAFPDNHPGGLRERYEQAYGLYFRSMERMLEQVSTTQQSVIARVHIT